MNQVVKNKKTSKIKNEYKNHKENTVTIPFVVDEMYQPDSDETA